MDHIGLDIEEMSSEHRDG